jgi:hypothetical protein
MGKVWVLVLEGEKWEGNKHPSPKYKTDPNLDI